MPIESVPDPVFAQKMTGDGLALDPVSNTLLAPCNGQITQIHKGQHELTISNSQIDIVMHIGLNTAVLNGEGFLAHVAAGDKVYAGQKLIEFDPDYVAAHASSLLTVILITNTERVDNFYKAAGDVQAGKDVLMELALVDSAALAAAGIYKPISSEIIVVPNHSGLHFRPAAVLSSLCRGFMSDIMLRKGAQEANARSVSSIMGLDIRHNDEVRLSASGPDAYEAISVLTPAIINGLGEEGSTPIQAPASTILPAIAAPASKPRSSDPQVIKGLPAAAGLAVGFAYQYRPSLAEVVETAQDSVLERKRLDQALRQSKLHLEALRSRTQAEADPGQAALIAAQHELLDDPELLQLAYSSIERGQSAEFAWLAAINAQAVHLDRLQNEPLAVRAADLRATGRRMANRLHEAAAQDSNIPPGSILIAEDIPAAHLATIEASQALGLVTVLGSAYSETSARSRALSIPAVVGAETRALEISNGTAVILDGQQGTLQLNPTAEAITAANSQIEELEDQRHQQLASAFEAAASIDGHPLSVQAAVSTVQETQKAMQRGADGICWLATEHLFYSRRTPPTEDEQTIAYIDAAKAVSPDKALIIRTLDVSSQRRLPYLPQAPEPNPALGLQGISFTLDQPHLLRKQCRAIMRAAADTGQPLKILLPRLESVAQWHIVRDLINIEQEKMEIEAVPVGLLIQSPAAAVSTGQLARDADFLVLETDDLAQYSMAMDRHHPMFGLRLDALEPAVLRIIHLAAQGAAAQGKPLTVYGAVSSDPQAIPLLVGLGVSGFDVSPTAVPAVKAHIRSLNRQQCQELAQEALRLETAVQVRELVM